MTSMAEAAAGSDPGSWQRSRREQVEAALRAALPDVASEPPSLHLAMRHSLLAGGKRIRPLLAIAAGEACGSEAAAVMPAACALEMVHTYSLIHDDLPAFDDEQLRRGQPTCHVLYGEAVAILAGDALQALAFEHLATAVAPGREGAALRATAVLARAAGSLGMCGGQTLDIEAAGNDLSLPQLRRLHAAKTGALLTASVLCGGILAGGGDEQLEALRTYGDAVGLAFQIVDDLLDVQGDAAELGKRPGGDAARGQPTFPALVGLDAARAEAEALRSRATAAVAGFGARGTALLQLADTIVDRRS